ncbi:hypothetical protein [Streptomyces sp. NPDC005805]|uniref:hypothetical protein n=1 Tax=Streptomyces sp. NPDC005805 TaxID=3157068 RepID=UPI003400FFC8
MSAATGTRPAAAPTAEEAGRRVEEILQHLADSGDEPAREAAEELVRVLMDFYGAGLARAVDLLGRAAPRNGAGPLEPLLGDELVASLLVLHDLHPEDTEARIARALATVAGGGLEHAGYDERTGVLRLRPAAASGCGCGSTADAARQAAIEALCSFAPEVTDVDLLPEAPREPALLQIGTRPGGAPGPAR